VEPGSRRRRRQGRSGRRPRQARTAPTARHLAAGTLVLYDVSSAAFEGRTCPLGCHRAPQRPDAGRLQIVYGLLTSKDGIPRHRGVQGNTGDPKTAAARVSKVEDRFALTRVVLVGAGVC
jgi:hypothetical protein